MARKSKPPPKPISPQKRARSGEIASILTSLWIRFLSLTPALSSFALLWVSIALLETVFQAVVPGTSFQDDQLPIGARFLLLSYSLTVTALFLAAGVGILGVLAGVGRRLFSSAQVRQRWIGGWTIFFTGLASLIYFSSWGLFWQTGRFVDSQSFRFLLAHPLQIFHWVDIDIAITIITLALLAICAFVLYLNPWLRRQDATTQRRCLQLGAMVLGICLVGYYLGASYIGVGDRQYRRSAIVFERNRQQTSGPAAYFLVDLRRHLNATPRDVPDQANLRIIQRPLIAMEHFLASIPREKFRPKNVVLIVVESLRSDQLRAYGASRDIMPTVNSLATESRVFTNAYSQSSHTDYATLAPLSSHYPLRSTTSYTYPERPTYPRVLIYDVLKGLGYSTAIFSSSNEYWSGMIHFLQTGNIDRLFHAATFKGPTYVMQGDAGFADWTRETQHAGSVDDRYTVAEAVKWIDSVKTGPFFVALNFQSSHVPYMVPRDFPRRFGPKSVDFKIRFAHFPKDKIQLVKDIYADSLDYVDAQISTLINFLKAKRIWDDTVIVITSDHGQAFYEHGFASHASAIFNEVMKVPLIIRSPGLEPGIDHRLAQHVDIAPSVLALLGIPPHPSFQGIDLLLSPVDSRRSAYLVAQTPLAYQYGVIRSGLKLVYDEWERRYSLYDLATDPSETKDVAGLHPLEMDQLAQRLQTWRRIQIDYYQDTKVHARAYPPIIADD